MSALICGSMAFDNIMVFEGKFADQILPNQLHILNVSFLVPTMRREFGGCAGNIAYALHQLGGDAHIMATMGQDGHDYVKRMASMGIGTQHLRVLEDQFTAQAMIITDKDNNQINGFHPGAMAFSHTLAVPTGDDIKIGIVAPDGFEGMVAHAEQFAAAKIPFIFDPGQQLPRFDGEQLRHMVSLADWVCVNDYEYQMLCERTGWTQSNILQHVQGLVVTLGAQGAEVWTPNGGKSHVPAQTPAAIKDPTGCGDAFRAGLLYGLERGWDLNRAVTLGNHMGAIKIAHNGCQNYQVDRHALPL